MPPPVPLAVLAAVETLLLGDGTARSFFLVTERDRHRPRFDDVITSTRRRLDSAAGDLIAVVFAYAIVVTLILSVPHEDLPAWHVAAPGSLARFSAAGWRHVLVSLPLLPC